MIGLDTNVLVRYIMQDDPRQSPEAGRLIERIAASAGCERTMTFDVGASKAAGMVLIRVP
jgi:predicted nucleic-acid-binding protein